jgi:hypothetical protein
MRIREHTTDVSESVNASSSVEETSIKRKCLREYVRECYRQKWYVKDRQKNRQINTQRTRERKVEGYRVKSKDKENVRDTSERVKDRERKGLERVLVIH